MNNNVPKVFKEANIDKFIERINKLFDGSNKSRFSNAGQIYLLKFNSKNQKEIPKHIYKFLYGVK